jgi:glycosyltransferase involved in cell wall biosynthesis
MTTTVSIAMTTYNGEIYLREQLDSLYSQTRQPDEVIAVDDGSTDNTLKILEEYHQRNGLQYFSNKNQLGINLNFNRAISLCTSDYVAICDQDDVWFPEKIERLLLKMSEVENQNPCLIVSDLILSDKNLQPLRKFRPKCFPNSIPLSILGNARQGCCMFLNRRLLNLILPIPDTPALHNNYDFYISVMGAMCGEKCYLAEPLMYYRVHGGNAVGNTLSSTAHPLARWVRKLTQNAYELSIHNQFEALMEIKQNEASKFRSDRILICHEVIEVCKYGSLYEYGKAVMRAGCFTWIEKIAIIHNTILLTFMLLIKRRYSVVRK